MWIEQFNGTIDIWINELDSNTKHQMSIKPDSKSWSLGQLYQHIIDETTWYNEQIEISLVDKENVNKKTSKEAKTLLERGSFENKRFQGDPFISENVKQPTSITQLKSDLENLKRDSAKIEGKMQNITYYGKSEHPGIGYLNCFEWLQYSEMHMRHHLKQKRRIEFFIHENT